jgi:hypothetical protein
MIIKIPSGHQVELGKTWNSQQVEAVIGQLETFGARNVKDLSGRTLRDFAGLLYSTDKPISAERIETAHETVVEHQEKRSVQEFTKNALGLDASLRDKRTRKRGARSTTLEIRQDVPPNTRPTGKEVALGVTVAPDGHDTPDLD